MYNNRYFYTHKIFVLTIANLFFDKILFLIIDKLFLENI